MLRWAPNWALLVWGLQCCTRKLARHPSLFQIPTGHCHACSRDVEVGIANFLRYKRIWVLAACVARRHAVTSTHGTQAPPTNSAHTHPRTTSCHSKETKAAVHIAQWRDLRRGLTRKPEVSSRTTRHSPVSRRRFALLRVNAAANTRANARRTDEALIELDMLGTGILPR